MKQFRSFLLSLILFIGLFFSLYFINTTSLRANTAQLTQEYMPDDGLILLEGGSVSPLSNGTLSYELSFYWNDPGYLFHPRGTVDILINGAKPEAEELYRGTLYTLPPSENNRYTVTIYSRTSKLSLYQKTIYIGSHAQINDFQITSIQCNFYIQGLCFAVTLFSLVLLFWKRSEKYLFWLALCAFLVGSYERLEDFLRILAPIPAFSFLFNPNFYRILHESLVAFFQYKILEKLLPPQTHSRTFLPLVAVAALPVFLSYRSAVFFIISILLFYTILYSCFLACSRVCHL